MMTVKFAPLTFYRFRNPPHSDVKAPLRRRALGSALAAFVGWLALNVPVFVFVLIGALTDDRGFPSANEWFYLPFFIAIWSLILVFATWLGALLPLYLFVPMSSPIWRWQVCTSCGSVAGGLIMFAVTGFNATEDGGGLLIIGAALTGGATCLFGSLTATRYQWERGG